MNNTISELTLKIRDLLIEDIKELLNRENIPSRELPLYMKILSYVLIDIGITVLIHLKENPKETIREIERLYEEKTIAMSIDPTRGFN